MCRYKYFILLVLMTFFFRKDVKAQTRDFISLGGEWNYQLYNVGDTIPEKGILTLPGTLDTNGIGFPVAPSANTSQLSRRVSYTGDVTYSRIVEIPESWRDMLSKGFRTSFNLTPVELIELLNGEDVSASEIRGARNESYDH